MVRDVQRDPHAHFVTKPLPSQLKGEGETAAVKVGEESASINDPFVRAENEDDDGYDPYSDRPAPREPLFERDPWA
jgi:hypothetical protein